MQDLFMMNRRENVAVAKKIKSEMVYSAAIMDCPDLQYFDVQTMLYGLNVDNVSVKNMVAVLDAHHGWRKMLGLLDRQTDLGCINDINVASVHYLSGGFGSPWEEIPFVDERKIGLDVSAKEAAAILSKGACETEKALSIFLWCCRRRPFALGNRLTGYLAANRHLIASGRGVLVVVERVMPEFRKLLVRFERDGIAGKLLDFMLEECISGIVYGEPGTFV
ncbi:MAG: hypothetical protein LBQ12_01520 [Deltaproteobacteria bacterium]|jgi:hypothetical protein|nr:hypothetical protein [Deltaproteobacteria bacterium]